MWVLNRFHFLNTKEKHQEADHASYRLEYQPKFIPVIRHESGVRHLYNTILN